jgi:hypothetical protein
MTDALTPWWRGATIYQIYPRSFADSNGDGIGDLAGITAHLPYVASLGVDAIWLSPFFKSPMRDFGYDVSDYCDVDPIFGTLPDFDEMLAAAHDRGDAAQAARAAREPAALLERVAHDRVGGRRALEQGDGDASFAQDQCADHAYGAGSGDQDMRFHQLRLQSKTANCTQLSVKPATLSSRCPSPEVDHREFLRGKTRNPLSANPDHAPDLMIVMA